MKNPLCHKLWQYSRLGLFVLVQIPYLSIHVAAQSKAIKQHGTIFFVKADATDGGDGRSWKTAFSSLQEALDAANSTAEIWVAKGSYLPEKELEEGDARTRTFMLKNNVTLLGGFEGNEQTKAQRDWSKHLTILDGDLAQNDGENKIDENAYHVVSASDNDSTTRLDGFVVSGGNANADVWPHDGGGGMNNFQSSTVIKNCVFTQNHAFADGGGIRNWGLGTAQLINCTFKENTVEQEGGGLMNGPESQPIVINCLFTNNRAGEDGAGMYNNVTKNQIVVNCVFLNNTAGLTGGGMYNVNGSAPLVLNCTFNANKALEAGGAISNRDSHPSIRNCIIWENTAPINDEINNLRSEPTILYSNITGGYDGDTNMDSDPLFSNEKCQLSASSPCIDKGNTTIIPAFVTTDFILNSRVVNGNVDMGALEWQTR